MKALLISASIVLMFALAPVKAFSQDEALSEKKVSRIEEFNLAHNEANTKATVDFNIKMLRDEVDLDNLVELMDKLDDKITKLEANVDKRSFKISYSDKIELLDLLQILKKKGYPATYMTPEGQKACLNNQGEIEYWNVKN